MLKKGDFTLCEKLLNGYYEGYDFSQKKNNELADKDNEYENTLELLLKDIDPKKAELINKCLTIKDEIAVDERYIVYKNGIKFGVQFALELLLDNDNYKDMREKLLDFTTF